MKSIKLFLESLPEPARTRAFKNVDPEVDINEEVENMEIAIASSFKEEYEDTPEGFKYWYDIFIEADKAYHDAREQKELDFSGKV